MTLIDVRLGRFVISYDLYWQTDALFSSLKQKLIENQLFAFRRVFVKLKKNLLCVVCCPIYLTNESLSKDL